MGTHFSTDLLCQNLNHLSQKEKDTKLLDAALKGRTKKVDALIKAGANPNAKDRRGIALLEASENGNTDIVALLIQAKADLDAQTHTGMTALMLAAQRGHIDIVVLLIQAKANLDAASHDGKHNAMEWATISDNRNRRDMINLLFSVMTAEKAQQEINRHFNLPCHFVIFKEEIIAHRMDAFKILGGFSSRLPIELIRIMANYYCALGNKAWHVPRAELDARKVCDAIANNGPLTFSSEAPPRNSKRKTNELEDEGALEQSDNFSEEETRPKNNTNCIIF